MRRAATRLWAQGNTRLAAALLAMAIAGCGDAVAPVPTATDYRDPGFVEDGGYRLRYALTLASDLPATIAGSYGIVPRRNLAVLMVTLERANGPPGERADAASVAAESVALTGERRTVVLTRHDEPGGPTWLGTVTVMHRVPVTIEIRMRADAASPMLRARLTREFRLE